MARHLPAVVSAAIVVLVATTTVAHAAGTPDAGGAGEARASVVQVGPVIGSVAGTVTLAQSIAAFADATGRAQSRAVDPGLFGLMLTTPLCPGRPAPLRADQLPPTITARSGEANADEGKSHAAADTTDIGQRGGAAGGQRVRAGPDGSARSQTTLAALNTSAIVVAGGRSDAEIRAHGGRREAIASSVVETLDLAGVRLEGLHWEAHHSGTPDGSFGIGRVIVGGAPVPLPDGDGAATLAAANAALASSGFSLTPPEIRRHGTSIEVTPLRIAVRDSALARQTVGPLLAAMQPLRQPFGDAVTADCSLALAYTAGDLGLQATAGSGGFIVEIGGASVSRDDSNYTSPFSERLASSWKPLVEPAEPSERLAPRPDAAAPTAVNNRSVSRVVQERTRVNGGGPIEARKGDVAFVVGLAGLAVTTALLGAERIRERKGGNQ